MSNFTPNKKIKMSDNTEISPEQAALDIKALNLFSRQNAALGETTFATHPTVKVVLTCLCL